ncbi:MAG: beta-galactosidase [Akkermansiaceae bacterium]
MITKFRPFSCCSILTLLLTGAHAAPPAAWPYWPEYQKTPLNEIRPQEWKPADHVIEGWDWSLPSTVKPAPSGLLAVYRTSDIERPLNKEIQSLDLPVNPTLEIWLKWRDLEPVEGHYRFDLLRERISEAEQAGCSVVLRILSSATIFAPEWLMNYQIPLREEKSKNKPKVTNYEISAPEFHKRYLQLVEKLGESGIPQLKSLKGAFVGYASPSYGDEGIGPQGVDPDTVPHVVERLDAWAWAFENIEHKVFMGGISQHGFQKGFGTRRGFVEMFLYHIPDPVLGQTVDKDGYLFVDDSVELLKRRAFHGEENEEYEETWATKERGFRFGENTDSFTYRYFISNLRTLQMQCNHVLVNPFSIYPEQMVWVGQTLGRTVEDSPDIWCALRESYVRSVGPVKNIERWLYQRDSPGFETTPVVKIFHPIKMWMVQPDQNFDYIARRGKQIGLAVDDRWAGGGPVNIAVKTTYFDKGQGTIDVALKTSAGDTSRQIQLTDSGKLKTSTIFIKNAVFPAKEMDHDILFKSTGDAAVLSFVRIIRLN